MEIWKPVIGYENLYEVSNEGNVRSLDRFVNTNKLKFQVKIKILAEQAGFYVAMFDPGNKDNEAIEKFAELIVKECIDIVVNVLPDIVPESKDGIHPAWHLKEHFGVEE